MHRIGLSNDIHSLEKKDSFIYLGGTKISSNYEIISHSDGDIILLLLDYKLLFFRHPLKLSMLCLKQK